MVSSKRGPSDPIVASLIIELRKASNANDAKIWRAISKTLVKPRRNRSEVNISKINRHCGDAKAVLVPGKILGAGEISKPITVAAIAVSESARAKIVAAKGRVITISELVKENPKGTGVLILG